MSIDSDCLKEITRRILSIARPEKIILFGSAAAGTMTVDSDIDLLIIEKSPVNTREDAFRLRRVLCGMGFPFDIIVMAKERFEETKNIIGGIAYPANKYGKVIYEAGRRN